MTVDEAVARLVALVDPSVEPTRSEILRALADLLEALADEREPEPDPFGMRRPKPEPHDATEELRTVVNRLRASTIWNEQP